MNILYTINRSYTLRGYILYKNHFELAVINQDDISWTVKFLLLIMLILILYYIDTKMTSGTSTF